MTEEQQEKTDIECQVPNEAVEEKPQADITVESAVEAVLFASDEPLTAERLADIIETGAKQIRRRDYRLAAV